MLVGKGVGEVGPRFEPAWVNSALTQARLKAWR